jgi:hypothetical protein
MGNAGYSHLEIHIIEFTGIVPKNGNFVILLHLPFLQYIGGLTVCMCK